MAEPNKGTSFSTRAFLFFLLTAIGNIAYSQSVVETPAVTQDADGLVSEIVETDDAKKPDHVEVEESTESMLAVPTEEIAALRELGTVKEENRLLKEFQDSLLSTVHWSLGVVVTMLLVLAGINWFANFKFYERDKTQLRAELESFVTTQVNDGTREARSIKLEALEEVDQRLEHRLTEISKQFVALNTHNEVAHGLKDELRDLEDRLEGLSKDLNSRLDDNAFDNSITETYLWETKKLYGNALSTLTDAMKLAARSGSKWKKDFVLEKVKRVLKQNYVDKDKKLDKDLIHWTLDAIGTAKDTNPELVAEISSILEDIPTK